MDPSLKKELEESKNSITSEQLSTLLKRAERIPPLQNMFVPSGNPDPWQIYKNGYGSIDGFNKKYLEDVSDLGKKRLQAHIFLLSTNNNNNSEIIEMRRKAMAFSQ